MRPTQFVFSFDPPSSPPSTEEALKVIKDQARPAADVARILDEAQVPNILWGGLPQGLVARWNEHEKDVEFITLDHLIFMASNALIAAGFTPCSDPDCREVHSKNNDCPIAPVHFHIEAQYPQHGVLRVYAKSSHLWWLPDFEPGPPAADDPDLMLSNDSRLPPYVLRGFSGPWTELYPIKILNPSSFTEAAWWLTFRDIDYANGYEYRWTDMVLASMQSYTHPHRTMERTLRPKFQAMWKEFDLPQEQRTRRTWDSANELMYQMRDNNELPPAPTNNWWGTVEAAKQNDCLI
ncbi:unnamed protein product [Penicillium camemberti]|uniref:Str. FM013 n=1 Tax=Penicillium camemberti (strain FM 013) TaxID=1429867 RepID=A0A0G4PQW8_PENC3|nr:unnamed protein product [Penicillium camemberti]